ncbi:MAG TPA: AraC family transcriptional regulator [Bacteroidia bacterium]|nr:AraC family transcriptional regulator [Bacteroidia bacterium]
MARPQLEVIPTGPSQALVFKIDQDIWPVYHYHPEYDILLSLKDHAGEFLSGDHIGRLGRGTLVMNGPNIPHAFHSGKPDEGDPSRPSLAVIQFSRESLGVGLLCKQEMQPVREFLDSASRGFEFFGSAAQRAAGLILEMECQTPFERYVQLLRLLHHFAISEEKRPLASPAYSPSLKARDISRLDKVLGYLRRNKAGKVALEHVAAVAKMSPKSFCRFFKANTGKTLVEYVHELRIGEACRQLLETDLPVSEIAFECGFNNLSNFNRRFREIKGVTPRDYRRQNPIDPAEQGREMPPEGRWSGGSPMKAARTKGNAAFPQIV